MTDAISHRHIRTNGIEMNLAEAGRGPLVVFCHGFPELSYSWRHQLPALARAGYHAVAPDQRGYGDTSRPEEVEAYDIIQLTDDMLGLLDALDEEAAVFVGHDWGAPVVWNLALRAPERVRAVVALSVPYTPRSHRPPTEIWKKVFSDTWFYILYFQKPGIADADLARNPVTTMKRFLCSLGGETAESELGPLAGPRDGRGMVERLPEPGQLPDWLTEDDLDHYVSVFERTGFTGGLNWYRNFDRNWALTADLAEARIEMPALFIAGARDPVIRMIPPDRMESSLPDLRGSVIMAGAGHWIQQERPHEVNAALIGFLEETGTSRHD